MINNNKEVERMRDKLFRKGLVVCILCLLTLVISPFGICIESQKDVKPTLIVDDIEYPKENGPYRFIMLGNYCSTGNTIEIEEGKIIIGPFVYLKYPYCKVWMLPPNLYRIIFINNNVVEKDIIDEWREIEAFGFKGFSGNGFFVFGICDEINIY